MISALTIFCMVFKFFDYLRLLEQTAFYIMLISETLNDIRAFIILLFGTLYLFGMPMVMLNLNRGTSNQIVEPVFGFWMADMLLN